MKHTHVTGSPCAQALSCFASGKCLEEKNKRNPRSFRLFDQIEKSTYLTQIRGKSLFDHIQLGQKPAIQQSYLHNRKPRDVLVDFP